MSLQEEFSSAVGSSVHDLLSKNPSTNARELRAFVEKNVSQVGHITLAQAFLGSGAARPTSGSGVSKPKAAPGAAADLNPRTQEGRDEIDRIVLEKLRSLGEDVPASAIRELVGLSPAQLRQSLNRLIEAELADFSGQARGTRYSAKG